MEHISKKTCFLCGRDSSDLTFGGGKEDTYATPKTSKYINKKKSLGEF